MYMTSILAVLAAFVASASAHTGRHNSTRCRILPGDVRWPSDSTWHQFNATIHGRLIATVPLATSCHGAAYDAEVCARLRVQWDYPWIHSQDPTSIDQPWFQNGTCDPFHPISTPCALGNLVTYTVNISSAADVQASLRFAKLHNIRIAIKNTGHDFLGKNTGKGALGLWTHYLNTTTVLDYNGTTYSGPAMKIGSGTQAYQAYEAAHRAGYRVLGGTCPTVGLAGGYSQGAGHGALTSSYGLGADSVLEWEVVTPNGEHVVASPVSHPDLYWAISGGGGGTFGVVISMTTKLYEESPVGGSSLSFNTSTAGDAYWDAITLFQGGLEPLVDNGAVAVFEVTNTNFETIITAPNVDSSELKKYLSFFTKYLDQHNVTYAYSVTDDPSYYNHFVRYFGPLPGEIWQTAHLISSRLFPREVIQKNNSVVIAAYKNITADSNWVAAGVALNASYATAGIGPGHNAVLPAWRNALVHTLFYSPWDWNASKATVQSREDYLTHELAPLVESITPGSGTYLNEANFNQLDWQETFYGVNYPRLFSIKERYDPHSLLYARTAVGSEAWAEDGDGRLCRT